jgi:hypothetical protein
MRTKSTVALLLASARMTLPRVLERLNEDESSVTFRARLVGLNIPLSAVARIDSRAERVSRRKLAIGLAAVALVVAASRYGFYPGGDR